MKRPWQIWMAYCTALALVASAVGWLSLRAWESDRAERAAAEQASLEENVRLALWRMDSILVPFVAEESARAPSEYRSASTQSGGFAADARLRSKADLSSLLTESSTRVLLYFQIDSSGKLSSPQVAVTPNQNGQQAATSGAEQKDEMPRRLLELERFVPYDRLLAELPAAEISVTGEAVAQNPQTGIGQPNFDQSADNNLRNSRARGANEYQARQQLATNVNTSALSNSIEGLRPSRGTRGIRIATMTPVLLGGNLLLARQVSQDGRAVVQGCWLDWKSIRAELLAAISDLLPNAELRLAEGALAEDQTRLLAALPVQLVSGTLPAAQSAGFSPVQLSLATTWCALLLAALAVAVLLRGVMTLSERRADFVSAVTHELRTPLTTFRMYAEMLAEGMVPSEDDRRTYLNTLRVEADRLTHLVENVLAYARLERGGLGGRICSINVADLVEAVSARLGDRASQAGFELHVEVADESRLASVQADASAVEQILFNLVDNACKYASSSLNRNFLFHVETERRILRLGVQDYGPGIPADQQRKLFQPFSRSHRDTANPAPGVGLGLALSRRLARDMGGDLVLDARITEGATFVLTLPVLESANSSDTVPHAN